MARQRCHEWWVTVNLQVTAYMNIVYPAHCKMNEPANINISDWIRVKAPTDRALSSTVSDCCIFDHSYIKHCYGDITY